MASAQCPSLPAIPPEILRTLNRLFVPAPFLPPVPPNWSTGLRILFHSPVLPNQSDRPRLQFHSSVLPSWSMQPWPGGPSIRGYCAPRPILSPWSTTPCPGAASEAVPCAPIWRGWGRVIGQNKQTSVKNRGYNPSRNFTGRGDYGKLDLCAGEQSHC